MIQVKNVWKDQMDFQHENPPLGSDIAIKVAPLEQFYWQLCKFSSGALKNIIINCNFTKRKKQSFKAKKLENIAFI